MDDGSIVGPSWRGLFSQRLTEFSSFAETHTQVKLSGAPGLATNNLHPPAPRPPGSMLMANTETGEGSGHTGSDQISEATQHYDVFLVNIEPGGEGGETILGGSNTMCFVVFIILSLSNSITFLV